MTKYLSEDKYRELPDPALYQGRKEIDLELNDPEYKNIKPDQRVKIARDIEAVAASMSDKIISVTSGFSDTYREYVRVHSNGFIGEKESTLFVGFAEATVEGKEGRRPEA